MYPYLLAKVFLAHPADIAFAALGAGVQRAE